MIKDNLLLVVPTYNRPEEILEFLSGFSANFLKYGHKTPIIIFDDSDDNHANKNITNIAKNKNSGGIFYVGKKEKEKYLFLLSQKLKNTIGKNLLKQIFLTPSYGGNRNFTVAYTIGQKFITLDDDILPYGLVAKTKQSFENVLFVGKFEKNKSGAKNWEMVDFDIAETYQKFLGKKIKNVPQNSLFNSLGGNVEKSTAGALHSSIDGKETINMVKGTPDKLSKEAEIKFAQTQLTGDIDIDAEDLIYNFLNSGEQNLLLGEVFYKYILFCSKDFFSKENWRLSPAVLGADNRTGLPPFIPTTFRFEDFIYRIYASQNKKIATFTSGHALTHERSLNARKPTALDFFNEEVSGLMKKKLSERVKVKSGLDINIDLELTIDKAETNSIFNQGLFYFNKAMMMIEKDSLHEKAYQLFAEQLLCAYEFKAGHEKFHLRIKKIIEFQIGLLSSAVQIWPAVLEATLEIKNKTGLPTRKV